jgi:NTP pyrophosphatase (non-canonical NTP hydrolase)
VTTSSPTLTLARLREANTRRCPAFGHTIEEWAPERWALALLGEVGELANEVKKLIRGDGSKAAAAAEIADVLIYHDALAASTRVEPDNPDLSFDQIATDVARRSDCIFDAEHATRSLGEGIGQVLYALRIGNRHYLAIGMCRIVWCTVAIAAELGIDPDQAVIDKFNAVSRRVGSEVTL